MVPEIREIPEKKFIGMRLGMSLLENKTGALWQGFMPRRKEIKNTLSSDLFALQMYDGAYFKKFNPGNPFTKWAAVEVRDFDSLPQGMESYTLESGLYAVFLHKGSSTDLSTVQYIFNTWLPSSKEYILDNRPHIEVLGEKYKNNDPDSEEELWIPVEKLALSNK